MVSADYLHKIMKGKKKRNLLLDWRAEGKVRLLLLDVN